MPTTLTAQLAKALRSRLLLAMSESAVYTSWSDQLARENVSKSIAKQRALYDFDPHVLAFDDLKELGFGSWDDDLYLIPLWLHPFLKAGITLVDIGGGEVVVSYDENGKCNIDNDHRFGALAYGIRTKHLNVSTDKCASPVSTDS